MESQENQGWKLTGFYLFRAAGSNLSVEQREDTVKPRAESLEGLGTPPTPHPSLGTCGLGLPPRARGTLAS